VSIVGFVSESAKLTFPKGLALVVLFVVHRQRTLDMAISAFQNFSFLVLSNDILGCLLPQRSLVSALAFVEFISLFNLVL
jgi:hypothetical protein